MFEIKKSENNAYFNEQETISENFLSFKKKEYEKK